MTRCLLLAALVFMSLGARSTAAPYQKFASHFAPNAAEVPFPVRQAPQEREWTRPETPPAAGLKILAEERSGALWLGGTNGAARFDSKAKHPWDRWQYFYGRRWLQDNEAANIHVEESRAGRKVWVRTKTGVSLLEWRPMTLEEKAAHIDARIEARHVRHGFVADSHLPAAGDLSSNRLFSNDNDGLWTAMYLGAQCYRYAATKSPEARARAKRSVEALMRLEAITGVPGFYARSFVAKGEDQPRDGEWHPTPDGQWIWKGDTSSDESVGHYYGYALYYDLVADEAEKEAIRQVVRRMTDYLIQHDYDMPDLDGQPTRWGQWSLRYYQTEEGKYEAALRSLELLAFLKTTYHITGDEKYQQAYLERIQQGYAEHMRWYRRWQGGGEINFSDDELAYLSYQPLLKYEKDPKLRAIYLDGLRFTWSQIVPDRNPLWNYISAASGAGRLKKELKDDSRRMLERMPTDGIDWSMKNSHRLDVELRQDQDRFSKPQLTRTLAPDERRVAKWNSNPYIPDGGTSGHMEEDGACFLLPYWMGRYHGWVK